MKLVLICVGELKFKGLVELERQYIDKINFFTGFEVRGIRDIKSDDDAMKKKKEGLAILELLDKRDFVIALDQYGKKMDSLAFASFLEDKMMHHPHRLVFLIGGHAGLSELLNDRIQVKLSFSDLTFGHDIFRLLFLEQVYRAFTIIKKIKYHR
ncbi:MAG: 23S rRNA (pseudouridine(1915)-N(3))-methyltransferase RlmH [Candidatus Omnitrophota bacterium]